MKLFERKRAMAEDESACASLLGRPALPWNRHPLARGLAGFTMVEIALCLAIIGFALVAIIGVLPTGLNVQKDNREETLINHDAAVWMDAIRNGAQGFDELTNYVLGITNNWSRYNAFGRFQTSGRDTYDRNNSSVTSITSPTQPFCPLTNGARIIGLLSTPRITPRLGGAYQSNYIVADVRSLSGYAIEKFPQRNPTILDASFSYRFIPEVLACLTTSSNVVNNNLLPVPIDPTAADVLNMSGTLQDRIARTNYAHMIWNLETNAHEIRLTFLWPVLPNGKVGDGRQTFRLLSGGQVNTSNDVSGQILYFAKPAFYARAP